MTKEWVHGTRRYNKLTTNHGTSKITPKCLMMKRYIWKYKNRKVHERKGEPKRETLKQEEKYSISKIEIKVEVHKIFLFIFNK